MACPNCSGLENLYGFHLERNAYYMTQVNEIKKCCPSKVYVTDFTSTDVTFTCNGKELNFLLDTGSTISYIDAQTAIELGCKFQNCNESVTGLGGNQEITEYCEVRLETPTTVTEIELPLANFKHAFSQIEEESGIEIHGLLGNNFLQASKH